MAGGKTWTVVGVFAAQGSAFGSEAWTGIGDVRDMRGNSNAYSSIRVKLKSPGAFTQFQNALANDPRLRVKVQRETTFYARQSAGLSRLISAVGGAAALLLGIAAIFGAMSTLYTAIADRTREIAAMRAVGFRRSAVLGGVLIENVSLALIGGVLGAVCIYVLLDGLQASTIASNGLLVGDFTPQVGFAFRVTLPSMIAGIAWALVMGFIGGLLPAIRAARLPIAEALREA